MAGGLGVDATLLRSAEVWSNGVWTPTGPLIGGRYEAQMITFSNGVGDTLFLSVPSPSSGREKSRVLEVLLRKSCFIRVQQADIYTKLR